MPRSSSLLAASALLLVGCGGHGFRAPSASLAPTQGTSTIDRMTVRTAEQVVVVDSPLVAGRRVERVVHETGGYLEQTRGSKDGKVRIVRRVAAGGGALSH